MISRTFIDRPVLAWVISILIMLGGLGGVALLPVEQYPDIAPPSVNIRASYPGAAAETLESSVTQIIEQQLTGIDGLIYFSSTSDAAGSSQISVTFERGTDPDIAQVQENKGQQALPRLPQAVQQQGLVVTKSNPDFLMVLAVYDETDKATSGDVSDYVVSNLQDTIGRLPGVGDMQVFGAQYAMRIWLDPSRLASYQLMPRDIITAIQAQNTQVAAGQLGALPSDDTQMLNATVTARSRFTAVDQFQQIIIKTRAMVPSCGLRTSRAWSWAAKVTAIRRDSMATRAPAWRCAWRPARMRLRTAELVRAQVARQAKDFPRDTATPFPRTAPSSSACPSRKWSRR